MQCLDPEGIVDHLTERTHLVVDGTCAGLSIDDHPHDPIAFFPRHLFRRYVLRDGDAVRSPFSGNSGYVLRIFSQSKRGSAGISFLVSLLQDAGRTEINGYYGGQCQGQGGQYAQGDFLRWLAEQLPYCGSATSGELWAANTSRRWRS